MLEIIKKAAIGVAVSVGVCTLGKAIHRYGEKRYWEGKLVATVDCFDAAMRYHLNKDDSEVKNQETEEA